MPGELEQLRNRKAQLLIESEANRLALAAHFVPVRAAARWLNARQSPGNQSGGIAMLAVPVLGFFAAQRWLRPVAGRWISAGKLDSMIQLAQGLWGIWNSIRPACERRSSARAPREKMS